MFRLKYYLNWLPNPFVDLTLPLLESSLLSYNLVPFVLQKKIAVRRKY